MSTSTVAITISPMHERVHAQLCMAVQRETWIADTVAERLGESAKEAVRAARESTPLPAMEGSLEDLVGKGDVRAFLQRAVSAFHRREGAAYGALLSLGGEEAEVELRLAAWEHGHDSGRWAAARAEPPAATGASAVFDLLSTHLLEGLPCQPGAVLMSEDAEHVAWKHDSCPYRRDWEKADLPFATGCQIVSSWIRGFAAGADEHVEYRRPRSQALDDPRCEHELVQLHGSD